MQGLVHVRHQMDQEAQGFPARPIAQPAVGQHTHIFFDLRHHAVAVRTIAPGLVAAGREWNIDIVPGAGVTAPVAYLIGPVGVMHHHRIAAQQARDFRAGPRRTDADWRSKPPPRDLAAPGPSGRRTDEQREQEAAKMRATWQDVQSAIGTTPYMAYPGLTKGGL
jgi:hypothetical protein